MLGRWLAVAAMVSGAVGQRPAVGVAGPMGTVVGVVTCSDTQRAARFAQVALMLKQALEEEPVESRGRGTNRKEEPPPVVVMMKGMTGIDGRYSIAEVPVGDYYAIGAMEGYRLPGGAVASGASIDVDKVMAGFPVIHVAANSTTVANVVMRRGAGVSGRVLFDDGSPVVGFRVMLEPEEGLDALHMSGRFALVDQLRLGTEGSLIQGATNDRGVYRIAGVAPGKYRVRTVMQVEGGMKFVGSANGTSGMGNGGAQSLTIFAPGKFHKDEATVVEVRGDEEDGDVDIRVSLEATHTVRGRVMAKEDQHPLKHAFLVLADGKDKSFQMYTQVNSQGEFHFSFVPEGTYTLSVQGGYDGDDPKTLEEMRSFKPTKMYAAMKVGVVVGEHDVVVEEMLLDEAKKGSGEVEEDGPGG